MIHTIEKIADMISEEICDIKKYTECASMMKEEYPDIAEVMYTIGTQEEKHMEMLEDLMDKIVAKQKDTTGGVTPEMNVLISYIKKCDSREYEKAKMLQKQYSK